MRKKIRLIHRNKKRSRRWNKNITPLPSSSLPETTAPESTNVPPIIIEVPDNNNNTEVTGEVIDEKGNYRLVKFDEEDYHCMERKQDGRYVSHRSFENLRQARFHFDNEHE